MSKKECPEPNKPGCKYAGRCFSDWHHEYWPRADYEEAGTIERRWRNLGKNGVQLCRMEHDERHATQEPPEMPSRDAMIDDLIASREFMQRSVRNAIQAAIRARRQSA